MNDAPEALISLEEDVQHLLDRLEGVQTGDLRALMSAAGLGEMDDADLAGADLSNQDLAHISFARAKLDGADLRGSTLAWCNLQYASLRGANLEGADLRWADLRCANLEGAVLRNVEWDHAILEGVRGLEKSAFLRILKGAVALAAVYLAGRKVWRAAHDEIGIVVYDTPAEADPAVEPAMEIKPVIRA